MQFPIQARLATVLFVGALGPSSAIAQSEFDQYPAGLPSLGYASFLVDTSGDGRTIVGVDTLPTEAAFLIEDGTTTYLSQGNYNGTLARDLSDDGRILVGIGYSFMDKAIYWVDGAGPFDLPSPPGATDAFADAVNADGTVIVGNAILQNSSHAVRWVNDVPSTIDPPLGVSSVFFHDVSLDGVHMVGELNFFPNPPFRQAARWSETSGYTSLEFPVGAEMSVANGTSADGTLTIGSYTVGPGLDRAVAWDGTGALIEIHDPQWVASWGVAVDAAGSRALLRVSLPTGAATYFHDFVTGISMPLVDLLAQTGGPSLPIEDVDSPAALSSDGSTAIGNLFGQFSDPDYTLWSARINAFGQKVCGPAMASSTGVGASLLGSGSLSVSRNTGALTAALLPPGEFGLFLASQTLQPSTVVSTGATLCLGGAIGRFNGPGQVGMSDSAGTLSLNLDLGALAQPMGSVAGLPGETWYFQAWFRDSDPLPTSNLTDALSVTLTQ